MSENEKENLQAEIASLKLRIDVYKHQNEELRDALVETLPYVTNPKILERLLHLVKR